MPLIVIVKINNAAHNLKILLTSCSCMRTLILFTMLFSRSSERKTVDLELQKLIDFVTVLFEVRIYASFICVAFAENLEYSPILWWME